MAQASPANGPTQPDQPVQRSPLITEPISNHSVETMMAACRAAIANGEDVNAPDTLPHVGHNEGRPLDACLRQTHMPNRKSIVENLPVIELLLEHGADPRLYSKSVGAVAIPIVLARRYSVDEEEKEEHRAFWKHLLGLFEEAIVRIDANKKETEGDS
ncbi:uncharacterized protein N0V89_012081 [Didymosphaeria variabile]|uniref:Ankyrin n=1 Tax=Didymosphaeria variabile TaxID=1932322 RepID=A0A9W9C5Z7_9PLEO|nr:uncharacterized protein N0V89_012081 [Didymosphaeria variabile]KAJ4345945.1 hypothetical protein N0V89_012081 [Didymosphaeria variabile]